MSAPVAHRYWRMLIRQRCGNGLSSITAKEVTFKVAGATQAGTITASGGTNASRLNDGTTSTGAWALGFTTGAWIKFDAGVGVTVDIDGISWTPDDTFANFFSPGLIEMQYSDDDSVWETSWIVFSPSTVASWTTATRTFTRPARSIATTGEGRYWMIQMLSNKGIDNASPAQYGLSKIEMRLVAAGADQCSGGTQYSLLSSGAANAFDANDSSNWLEDYNTNTAIIYDFGSGVTKAIREVMLRSISTAGVGNGSPTVGRVCVGDNVNTFWPIFDWTLSAAGWGSGTTRLISDITPPFDGRRRQIRVNQ